MYFCVMNALEGGGIQRRQTTETTERPMAMRIAYPKRTSSLAPLLRGSFSFFEINPFLRRPWSMRPSSAELLSSDIDLNVVVQIDSLHPLDPEASIPGTQTRR